MVFLYFNGKRKTHIKGVHNKDKSLKCNACDYATSLNGNMQIHINGVHNKPKIVAVASEYPQD